MALDIIKATFVLLFLSSVQSRNIMLCILNQNPPSKESWTTLSEKPSSDTTFVGNGISESSDWMVEETAESHLIDLKSAFEIVREKVAQKHLRLSHHVLFRQIQFDSESISDIVQILISNRNSCDIFVYGFMHSNIFADNHHILCETVLHILSNWNVPTFSWTCPISRQDKVFETSVMSLLPNLVNTARAALHVLRYFNWRKVAILNAARPEPWGICGHMEHEILSSNYFQLKLYANIGDISFSNNMEFKRKNQTYFSDIWNGIRNLEIAVVIICLPPGGQGRWHASVVQNLLQRFYHEDETTARNLVYLIIDPIGVYNLTLLHRHNKRTGNKSKRNFQDNNETYLSAINLETDPLAKRKKDFLVNNKSNLYQDKSGYNKLNPKHLVTHFLSNRTTGNYSRKKIKKRFWNDQGLKFYENVLIFSPDVNENLGSLRGRITPRQAESVGLASLAYFLDTLYFVMHFVLQSGMDLKTDRLKNGRLV
ncbi:unnamed protein product [Clavelina lepadiformis]|uniref:Receptor ligand binding region domain-containing protein n=1 Tax=Clavelina lepadiformis TaxID=159417 RepID=A0ABP0GF82_CLALP